LLIAQLDVFENIVHYAYVPDIPDMSERAKISCGDKNIVYLAPGDKLPDNSGTIIRKYLQMSPKCDCMLLTAEYR
jgi:hypothetical protein